MQCDSNTLLIINIVEFIPSARQENFKIIRLKSECNKWIVIIYQYAQIARLQFGEYVSVYEYIGVILFFNEGKWYNNGTIFIRNQFIFIAYKIIILN